MINILIIIIILGILEILAIITVKWLRRKFQWLIIPEDDKPILNREKLKVFIKNGYDPILGWVRKPNTWHFEDGKPGQTTYHIDKIGSRCNPGHEKMQPLISCYGDSFTFCRQVNDNETWQWYLSTLTDNGVLNFGVGNYGIDQAYFRILKEFDKNPTKIVILGVVPSTIVRILCVWKHYNEFGNTFAFKPRFDLKNGEPVIIKNIIDRPSKFLEYQKYLSEIQDNDFFYKSKFHDEMIRFPYVYSIIRKFNRNIPIISFLLLSKILNKVRIKNNKIDGFPLNLIMKINLNLRIKLFSEKYATDIFRVILNKYIQLAKIKKFIPVFLLLPQKDDLIHIRKNGNYYKDFINEIKKNIFTVDLTDSLINHNDLDILYSDDNVYGGHFSKDGNKLIAKIIYDKLKQKKLVR